MTRYLSKLFWTLYLKKLDKENLHIKGHYREFVGVEDQKYFSEVQHHNLKYKSNEHLDQYHKPKRIHHLIVLNYNEMSQSHKINL